MTARFVELHQPNEELFAVNVDAIDTVSPRAATVSSGALLRMRGGAQLYTLETYDEVHAQLYDATHHAASGAVVENVDTLTQENRF